MIELATREGHAAMQMRTESKTKNRLTLPFAVSFLTYSYTHLTPLDSLTDYGEATLRQRPAAASRVTCCFADRERFMCVAIQSMIWT